ncbi:MAG: methyltransferase domain-containing protein [Deltaproteobacteria bacterium]|nr:methyltransferase domain-containing protein [Deltaproteobacteria bacterium]
MTGGQGRERTVLGNVQVPLRQWGKAVLGPRVTHALRQWEGDFRRAVRRHRLGDRSSMSYDRALEWAKRHSGLGGGISQTSRRRAPYPEVTGYFIPTLLDFGERALALRHARWLAAQARSDGAILGPDGCPYTFDTAQALRGFLAACPDDPSLQSATIAAADFVASRIGGDGTIDPCTRDTYLWSNGHGLPPGYLLYALPPLLEASRVFGRADWGRAVERVLAAVRHDPVVLDAGQLSHFYAYALDALIDLGEAERVRRAVTRLFESMRPDGSLPAYPGVSWTCSPGSIQFAVIAYKLGMWQSAEQLYRWAERVQEAGGGFLGSYGSGAEYSGDEEVSWAVKYFLDATLWRVKTSFNAETALHPEVVEPSDPRLVILLARLGEVGSSRVLDLGCGKGRFGKQLLFQHPGCALTGVDASEEMLRGVAGAFPAQRASILRLPFEPDSFHAAYAVESFEHVLNLEGAFREVHRCLKPGGRLVVIDKNVSSLGILDLAPWEKWFDPARLLEMAECAGFATVEAKNFELAPGNDSPTFFAASFEKRAAARNGQDATGPGPRAGLLAQQ